MNQLEILLGVTQQGFWLQAQDFSAGVAGEKKFSAPVGTADELVDHSRRILRNSVVARFHHPQGPGGLLMHGVFPLKTLAPQPHFDTFHHDGRQPAKRVHLGFAEGSRGRVHQAQSAQGDPFLCDQ